MTTELKIDGGKADFLVRTDDPLYQDRIVKMGWRPHGGGLFGRALSPCDDIGRIFANFSRHIAEMIEQSARFRPVQWSVALEEFVDRIQPTPVRWWLYGSGALAVRGLEIEPGDLDIAVNDPVRTGAALSDLLVEPVTRMDNWVAKAGGRAFHGALIEWLSGAHPTGATPPHEQEPAAAEQLERITWHGRVIPVPKLELQLAVAERRGLRDRCELIRRAIKRTPCTDSGK